METPKDIYVIRSKHLVEQSKPSDSYYEVVVRQLDVSRRIMASLVEKKGVDNIFMDSLDKHGANSHNISLEGRIYTRGHISEAMKDKIKWIKVISDTRDRTGIDVRFRETEPRYRKPNIDDIIHAAASSQSPHLAQIGASMFLFLVAFCIMMKVDLPLLLSDKDLYQIVKKNSGNKNAIYMGRAHKLRDFYMKNSGFRTIGVTLEDDLTFSIDSSSNAPDELVSKFKKLVELSIREVTALR